MLFTLPPPSADDRPPQVDPNCRHFWRAYLAFLSVPLFVMLCGMAAALWPAGSITTSSRTPAVGSSSTACPASTPGSSR